MQKKFWNRLFGSSDDSDTVRASEWFNNNQRDQRRGSQNCGCCPPNPCCDCCRCVTGPTGPAGVTARPAQRDQQGRRGQPESRVRPAQRDQQGRRGRQGRQGRRESPGQQGRQVQRKLPRCSAFIRCRRHRAAAARGFFLIKTALPTELQFRIQRAAPQ